MSNLRQAAQRALEALDCPGKAKTDDEQAAITALRAALAEPDSDYERGFVDGMNLQTKGSVDKAVNRMAEPEQEPVAWKLVPVKPTNEMLKAMDECSTEGYDERLLAGHAASVYMAAVDVAPLFTAPTPRKPLTDEQCDSILIALDEWARRFDHYEYGLPLYSEELRGKAREVMRIAHGIGGDA